MLIQMWRHCAGHRDVLYQVLFTGVNCSFVWSASVCPHPYRHRMGWGEGILKNNKITCCTRIQKIILHHLVWITNGFHGYNSLSLYSRNRSCTTVKCPVVFYKPSRKLQSSAMKTKQTRPDFFHFVTHCQTYRSTRHNRHTWTNFVK